MAMSTLTVNAKGQVTLSRDLLQHLGVDRGQRVRVCRMPGGRIEIMAARPAGTADGFIGLLKGKSRRVATLEEIGAATAEAWTGRLLA